MVDEISLVVAPHVTGDITKKASFDTLGQYINDAFSFMDARKLVDGGVHLRFKKGIKN